MWLATTQCFHETHPRTRNGSSINDDIADNGIGDNICDHIFDDSVGDGIVNDDIVV